MEEQSNGKLAFNDTSMIQNKRNILVLVYMKPENNEQYQNYYNQNQRKKKENESVVSSLFYRTYSIIIKKDVLKKRLIKAIKELILKRYYKKIFKRITKNHFVPQLQQQTSQNKRYPYRRVQNEYKIALR